MEKKGEGTGKRGRKAKELEKEKEKGERRFTAWGGIKEGVRKNRTETSHFSSTPDRGEKGWELTSPWDKRKAL